MDRDSALSDQCNQRLGVGGASKRSRGRTIEEADVVRLSMEDQQRIAKSMFKPRAPAAALRRAFRRRRALLDRV